MEIIHRDGDNNARKYPDEEAVDDLFGYRERRENNHYHGHSTPYNEQSAGIPDVVGPLRNRATQRRPRTRAGDEYSENQCRYCYQPCNPRTRIPVGRIVCRQYDESQHYGEKVYSARWSGWEQYREPRYVHRLIIRKRVLWISIFATVGRKDANSGPNTVSSETTLKFRDGQLDGYAQNGTLEGFSLHSTQVRPARERPY